MQNEKKTKHKNVSVKGNKTSVVVVVERKKTKEK